MRTGYLRNMINRVTNYGRRVLDPSSGIMRKIGYNFIKGSILFVNGIIICELNSRKWSKSLTTNTNTNTDIDIDAEIEEERKWSEALAKTKTKKEEDLL